MSFLSGIADLFKGLLKLIKKLLKNIWFWVLVIVVILICIYAPQLIPMIWGWLQSMWGAVVGWMSTAWGAITSTASSLWGAASNWFAEASFGEILKGAAGLALIINPEGVISGVGGAVGEVIGEVIEALDKATGGMIWWALGGLAVWWLWPEDDERRKGEYT